MAYSISVKILKAIEVQNGDVAVVVRVDGKKLGTLTMSLGSIDWLPKGKWSGKKSEIQKTWTEFAAQMEGAR